MRTFILGEGSDRKLVGLEVDGPRVVISEKGADGTVKKSEKLLKGEAEARAAREKMAGALLQRGFVEKVKSSSKPAPAPTKAAAHAYDDLEEPAAPALPRIAAPVAAEAAPKKKKKKRKKQAAQPGDGLDKKVVAGALAFGVGLVALVGYFAYDIFLKPATIVGVWRGSRTEYEISQSLSNTQYELILDPQKRAAMMIAEGEPSTGNYAVKGDRLILTLAGEPDEEGGGGGGEIQYKFALGHTTLDLFDPSSGKKVVQLLRFPDEVPKVGGTKGGKAAGGSKSSDDEAPAGPMGALAAGDPAADAKLASVEYVAKDTAFKLKHPPGWQADTGGRPDNTYSWIKLNKGSAYIKVTADVTGSLMSGSDVNRNPEPGSESAPVHVAHELYQKTAEEEHSDYKESKPIAFNGSMLGEGRLSSYTASGGGLFGSKLNGYRVTLLTGDRRVSVLCECPADEFAKLKPTFLAICRSVAR